MNIAERACRHLHAPEWEALSPRQGPCAACVQLAEAIQTPLATPSAEIPIWTACEGRPCQVCIQQQSRRQA